MESKEILINYALDCLNDIETFADLRQDRKDEIIALIADSYNRTIAPAEVNAWILLKMDRWDGIK